MIPSSLRSRRRGAPSPHRSPRRQQALLAAALSLGLVGAGQAMSADEPAHAAVECGPGDTYRSSLALGASDQTLTPCLSGTSMAVEVPTSCLLTICTSKYSVREIRRHGKERVTYADGRSEELYHFTFRELAFRQDASITTSDNASGQLSIRPEGEAQIGGTNDDGEGMYTDVWATGGTFNITFTPLPSLLLCTIPIDAGSPLVEVVQGGTINGCGLDLDVKYLVAYNATPGSEGNYPVRLPKTSLEVTP